jgi:hypothetical protein
MRRTVIVSMMLMSALAVREAGAQSAAPPAELGVEMSVPIDSVRGDLLPGPRLVLNADGRNSILFSASFQRLSPVDGPVESKTDLFLAAYRRVVHASGPVRVFATIGGGLERTVIATPAVTFGNPPTTFPASRGVEVLPAFSTGAGLDYRLGRRAALVLESSFVLTDVLGGRLSAGLVVPLGAYPPRAPLPSPVPWATLDEGDRAWVTTGDGRELDGEVVARSVNGFTLRTALGVVVLAGSDVRAIDTTDPIRNGVVLGAKIGALGGVAPAVLVSGLYCSLEDCDAGQVVAFTGLFLGLGTAVGAATGALADSLRERRVPLYRRGGPASVVVAPLVGGRRIGAGAVIRW